MPNKLTTMEFIRKLKKLYGDKYDYSQVDYKTMDKDVTIICKEHGEFIRKPARLLYDKLGCPKCGVKKRHKHTKESFLSTLPDDYKSNFDYSLMDFTGVHNKVRIKCNLHNTIFEQTPLNHQQGHKGCPKCIGNSKARVATIQKLNKASSDIVVNLYYIKDKITGYYKIGVTKNSLKERFGKQYNDIIELKIIQLPENEAYSIEEKILELFDEHRVTVDSFGNGKTEFFKCDILGWDTKVQSLCQ